MAINTLVLATTYLMTLAYVKSFGQALTTLFAMVEESGDVLVVIVFLALSFGVASTPLLASLIGSTNVTLIQEVRERSSSHPRGTWLLVASLLIT